MRQDQKHATRAADIGPQTDQPYPLARNFYFRLLPALALLLAVLVVLVGFVVRQRTEAMNLERATRTAENIARDVATRLPDVWQQLLQGDRLSAADLSSLTQAFAGEQVEYRLVGLKLYDLDGRTLYSHNSLEIGVAENGPALNEVLAEAEPSVVRNVEDDGTTVLELYVPLIKDKRLAAVFELYEPADGEFQSAVNGTLVPVVVTLLGLLGTLIAIFLPIVRRAQAAITDRTLAAAELRRRLERLLSRSAVETMRHADPDQRPAGQRTEMTLLYSDIRGFTVFCEGREPEQTIAVLNRMIGAQVEAIERHGGDVDKIIGDAILVRFEGDRRESRAVATAIDIQAMLAASDLPLQVGIGLYSGPVVAGLLGTGQRLDYTVIGDSVNVVARLCAAAKACQIVGDVATIERSHAVGFGDMNELRVKGREQTVSARLWSFPSPGAGADRSLAGG